MRENNNDLQNKKLLILSNNALINGSGGVEHVLCNMANVMNDAGMDVTVVTVEKKVGKPFYHLDSGVKFFNLHRKLSLLEKIQKELTPKRLRADKKQKFISKRLNDFILKLNPDVIVCFSLPALYQATLCRTFKTPIILTVHGNPANDYTDRAAE